MVKRFAHTIGCLTARVLLLVATLVPAATAIAQPSGPTQPVTLEHADRLVGYPDPSSGESVVDLQGNVVILQGVVRIQADRALLYEARNYAVLSGNVRVTQPDLVLTAPRAEYNGNTRNATAPSGLTIMDKGATLRAGAGEYNMYDRRAQFRNGVTLVDSNGTLKAASGDYYSLERRAVFTGGVRATSDSGTMTARTLTYWRDTRESYAIGKVVIADRKSTAFIMGDTVRHRPADGYTLVLGHPKLVQIDTAARTDSTGNQVRDTTVITAMRLESLRGSRTEYIATDSVRMVRGDLQAMAARARYLPDESVIGLGSAHVYDSSAAASGDSARDTSRRGGNTSRPDAVTGGSSENYPAPPHGSPIVWYESSQLTGDTITVSLEDRKLRMIDVERNAFAISRGRTASRFDQLAGNRLRFLIERDTIRHVYAEGLASSIYYIFEGDEPNGVNRASGDTIVVAFDSGQVASIDVLGGRARAEGEYFPEKMVSGRESSFRLDGFRWYRRDGTLEAIGASSPASSAPVSTAPDGDTPAHGAPTLISTPRSN